MKKFIRQSGLSLTLALVFVAIFAFGNLYSRYMTEQIEIRREQQASQIDARFLAMFPGATGGEQYTPAQVSKTYTLVEGRGDFVPTVESAWKVNAGSQQVGVIYVVNTKGKNDMKLAFGFALADHSTKGVVVFFQEETPSYYSRLTTAFFDQFGASSLTEIDFGVDGIAGATYSSKGFEIGWQYAREVYAADYDFEIPTVQMNLVAVRYNFNPTTFASAPFIADITHGEANTPASVLLSATYDYVGLVGGGTDLAADLQGAVKAAAQAAGSVSGKAYFVSYDEVNRILVMRAKGYNSTNPIQVTFTVNETLDGIEPGFVVESHETYDDEANIEYGSYTGGPVPAAENYFLNRYQTAGVISAVDAVAGASQGTGPALRAMLTLLDAFLEDLNGGN